MRRTFHFIPFQVTRLYSGRELLAWYNDAADAFLVLEINIRSGTMVSYCRYLNLAVVSNHCLLTFDLGFWSFLWSFRRFVEVPDNFFILF